MIRLWAKWLYNWPQTNAITGHSCTSIYICARCRQSFVFSWPLNLNLPIGVRVLIDAFIAWGHSNLEDRQTVSNLLVLSVYTCPCDLFFQGGSWRHCLFYRGNRYSFTVSVHFKRFPLPECLPAGHFPGESWLWTYTFMSEWVIRSSECHSYPFDFGWNVSIVSLLWWYPIVTVWRGAWKFM